MGILVLFNLVVLVTTIVLAQPSTVRRGVVYSPQGSVSFATEAHTVVIELDTTGIQQRVSDIFALIHNIETKIGSVTPDQATRQATQMIQNVRHTLEASSDTFNSFLTSRGNREKRSTNIIGSIVGDLFGLVTNDELDQLEAALTKEAGQVHVKINKLISHLRVTDENVKAITRATTQAQEALRKIEAHMNTLADRINQVERDLILVQSVTQLAFATSELTFRLEEIITQIQTVLLSEEMSPAFLKPITFMNILKNLHETVPLLLPPIDSSLSEYYRIAKVTVKKDKGHFYFLLQIPIKNSESDFQLYSVDSVWTQDVTHDFATKIKINHPYLAVKDDESLAVTMPDLNHCKLGKTFAICDPRYVFFSADSNECLFSLYLGKSSFMKSCEFMTRTTFKEDIVSVGNQWVISTKTEIQVKEICDSVKKTKTIPVGISVLRDSHCFVQGQNFRLPSQGRRPTSHVRVETKPLFNVDIIPAQFNISETLMHLNLSKIDYVSPGHLSLLHSHVRLFTSHKRLHWGVLGGSALLMLVIGMIMFKIVCCCKINPKGLWGNCIKQRIVKSEVRRNGEGETPPSPPLLVAGSAAPIACVRDPGSPVPNVPSVRQFPRE